MRSSWKVAALNPPAMIFFFVFVLFFYFSLHRFDITYLCCGDVRIVSTVIAVDILHGKIVACVPFESRARVQIPQESFFFVTM